MANIKQFTIEINGVRESIEAVDSLMTKLNQLEEKIKALQGMEINIAENAPDINTTTVSADIDTSTNTRSTYDSAADAAHLAALKEEEAIYQKILETRAKIDAAMSNDNQKLIQEKETLKEITTETKAQVAERRLSSNEYSNTMQGLKQELKDIKQVMQTTDLGDDKFKDLVERANQLTTKLKDIESSYGQYGRNVGNYANGVAEGLAQIKVQVGDTVREFNNAREASRELGNELKSMAINGQQGTKEFKDMQEAVAQLNSSIKDATVSSQAMDTMLDTMESVVSIASTAQGIGTLFGMDNSKIEESIKKLVALQNVMQGIEKINQQLKSGEFMGGYLSKGNELIDKFVAKLTGANKAQQTLNQTTNQGATAAKGLAAAETAQAAATTTATVATKALSFALKTIGIGIVITAVAYLIENWEKLYKWFTDTIPALKNLSTWFDKIKAVAVGVGSAIVNYMVQPLATLVKVIKAIIEGNFSEIPNIIAEGLKKTFNVVENYQRGYNQEIQRQQEAHNAKMREQQKKANEEFQKDEEAKYGKSHKRTQEYLKKQLALTKEGTAEYKELQRRLWEDERQEREENQRKALASSKQYQKNVTDAEKELVRLRIENMKEGLNKTITQLEEERKAKIAKIRSDNVMVKELELETNKYYDKKIEEAKKEHSKELIKIEEDLEMTLLSKRVEYYRKVVSNNKAMQEEEETNNEEFMQRVFNQNIGSYGIQGKNQYSLSTQNTLGIISNGSLDYSKEMIEDYKKLLDLERDYKMVENQLLLAENNELRKEELDLVKMTYDAKLKLYNEYSYELEEKYSSQEDIIKSNEVKQLLIEENYTESLEKTFLQRISAVEYYWAEVKQITIDSSQKMYDDEIKLINEEEQKVISAENKSWRETIVKLNDWYKKKVQTIRQRAKEEEWNVERTESEIKELKEKYQVEIENSHTVHTNMLTEIDEEYRQRRVSAEKEMNNKLRKVTAEYYRNTLQEFRDFQTALNNLSSKQPVLNVFGFVNLKQTNKNNRELLSSYEELARQLQMKRQQLNTAFQGGLINRDTFDSTIREFDSFSNTLGDKIKELKHKLSGWGQIEMVIGEVNQYFQAVGQTMNTVLSSLSTITDNYYQSEIDKQQKYIDEYQDMLDKQKEATQEYADAVRNIEDELTTARGDRRQQLIDQLNAEMAAQRASLAQEKKIEKEKEKAEEKKKKLEHDQAVAKKKMQEAQAYINMAMAISMAAVNSWPIPAIPMMALAAAAGAAQIAAIKSQNIPSYGSGGIIQGKSHSQGGVKVLGGRAEVEGGEFITNKITTEKNVQLLEFINSKKRKVELDEMLEFYSNGKTVKKTISSVKTRFADGGQIPTLRNDITLSDRLLTAFEDYSNKPTYVSVVDIIDKSERLNEVKAISGLYNS